MRIVALTTAYHPLIGGAELAMQDIVRHLPDDVVVLTARHARSLASRDTVEGRVVHRLGIGHPIDRHLFAVWAPLHVWRLGGRKAFDAAWAMMANQSAVAALVMRVMLGLPYLLTLQEGDDNAWFSRRERLLGPLYKALFRFADAIQPISKFLEDRARSFDPTAPVRIVPNGADLATFAPLSREGMRAERDKLGVPQDAPLLVTASRLVRKNALDTVLDALALMPPSTMLVVAGSGPDQAALRAQASRLGVEDRVVWLGDVAHGPALAGMLGAGDVFVRPSRSEGLGTAFIEAMACGLPIAATHVGGIPDVVPEQAGILVAPEDAQALADACAALLADKASYGTRAKEAAQAFSWESLAARIRSQFEDMTQHTRVLVATGVYPPESGGPATYVAALQRELPQRGVSVAVYPFRWVRHLPPGVRHIAYACGLALRARGCDVVFAQDPVSVGAPAAIASQITRVPLVLKVVGDYAWEQARNRFGETRLLDEFVNDERGMQARALAWLERRVARSARSVVTPSAYLGSVVERWGVARGSVRVIYNGIAVPEAPTRANVRNAHSLAGIVAVTVGRLVPWKNVPDVARAALSVPGATLAVVGDGPDREAVSRIAERSGRIRLFGAVPRAEALGLTAAADFCVLYTAYEGFSHQLLEAFALGVPTITTAAGGNAELVRDGENALVVPLGDQKALEAAMARMAHDAGLRERLASAARADAARFTVPAMADRIAELLAEVAGAVR